MVQWTGAAGVTTADRQQTVMGEGQLAAQEGACHILGSFCIPYITVTAINAPLIQATVKGKSKNGSALLNAYGGVYRFP